MKSNAEIHIQAKTSHNIAHPSGQQTGVASASNTKADEHRYERRKIRESLRRLDSVPEVEDSIFA